MVVRPIPGTAALAAGRIRNLAVLATRKPSSRLAWQQPRRWPVHPGQEPRRRESRQQERGQPRWRLVRPQWQESRWQLSQEPQTRRQPRRSRPTCRWWTLLVLPLVQRRQRPEPQHRERVQRRHQLLVPEPRPGWAAGSVGHGRMAADHRGTAAPCRSSECAQPCTATTQRDAPASTRRQAPADDVRRCPSCGVARSCRAPRGGGVAERCPCNRWTLPCRRRTYRPCVAADTSWQTRPGVPHGRRLR